MARRILGHRPDLTADGVMKVFQHHLAGKYKIYRSRQPAVDFFVRQSAWKAVSVRLMQKRKKTILAYAAGPGSAIIRILMLVLALAGAAAVFSPGMSSSMYGGAGRFLGLMLWVWLVLWVPTLPGRRLEKEIKALIQKADEFN